MGKSSFSHFSRGLHGPQLQWIVVTRSRRIRVTTHAATHPANAASHSTLEDRMRRRGKNFRWSSTTEADEFVVQSVVLHKPSTQQLLHQVWHTPTHEVQARVCVCVCVCVRTGHTWNAEGQCKHIRKTHLNCFSTTLLSTPRLSWVGCDSPHGCHC